MPQKKTGVYNKDGKDANSRSQSKLFEKIDRIFDQAEDEFHKAAAVEGLEILRAMVPIDTQTLQRNLQAFREGNATVISVPDATLFYSESPRQRSAKAIALILNTGIGRSGQLLNRTKSNTGPNAQAGSPTKDWFDKAGTQMRSAVKPLVDQLFRNAIKEALSTINEHS